MMFIKGTDKIRGVLDLNSIKRQIKRNDKTPVSEKDVSNADIQIAIRMGYITTENSDETNPESISTGKDRVIRLLNKKSTPLSLPNQTHAIPPNAQFSMKESELKNPDVVLAVSKGLIEILNSIDGEKSSEGTLKISSKESTNISSGISDLVKDLSKKSDIIDSNEELPEPKQEKMPSNVIDSEFPAAVKASDIHDPLGKSVIFNPTGSKPINVIKNDTISENKKPLFVDEEQQESRIRKHPKLNPMTEKNKDLEFVDLDDLSRINPNLKSKEQE